MVCGERVQSYTDNNNDKERSAEIRLFLTSIAEGAEAEVLNSFFKKKKSSRLTTKELVEAEKKEKEEPKL